MHIIRVRMSDKVSTVWSVTGLPSGEKKKIGGDMTLQTT